jgi:hypothetical protein
MRKRMAALLAGAMLMMATSAMALPLNPIDSRGTDNFTFGTSSESSLQQVFDANIVSGTLNAIADQSNVAVWSPSDANQDQYLIQMISGATGTLGVYSYSDPTIKINLLTLPAFGTAGSAGFKIFDTGAILADNGNYAMNFGKAFGFYWEANNTYLYTEDDKNTSFGINSNIRALSYLLAEGTQVKTSNQTPSGDQVLTATATGDDWILAFEDWNDGDFNDAVFYLEDMSPVPEPGTMMLFGIGMLGLAVYGKRRMNKEA